MLGQNVEARELAGAGPRTASLMTARPGLSEETCTEKQSEPAWVRSSGSDRRRRRRRHSGTAAPCWRSPRAGPASSGRSSPRRRTCRTIVGTGTCEMLPSAIRLSKHLVTLTWFPAHARYGMFVVCGSGAPVLRRLLRYPHTPWSGPWLRVPRARQTSVSYACVSFPHCCCFPKRSTYEPLALPSLRLPLAPSFRRRRVARVVPSSSLDF